MGKGKYLHVFCHLQDIDLIHTTHYIYLYQWPMRRVGVWGRSVGREYAQSRMINMYTVMAIICLLAKKVKYTLRNTLMLLVKFQM